MGQVARAGVALSIFWEAGYGRMAAAAEPLDPIAAGKAPDVVAESRFAASAFNKAFF